MGEQGMLRLGVLAASRIARQAVVAPLADPGVDGVQLVAVAARDHARATAAAGEWGARLAFGDYAAMLAEPEVDAVYIATPASSHRYWSVAALEAGKHVLVEKPIADNADDARLLAAAAAAHPDLVVMEAFHWRYHPLAARIAEVLRAGTIGRVERVETRFDIPDGRIPRSDIRWDLALGGGATMDLGCYAIQWARHAVANCPEHGGDPTVLPEVVSAVAVESAPGIDGALTAELRWPGGATGSVGSSMVFDGPDVVNELVVHGTLGTLTVPGLAGPQKHAAELRISMPGSTSAEPADTSSTYFHQMVAFRDAIAHGTPFPTTVADGVRNMEIIDACYRAAGMQPRPTQSGG